MSDQDDLGLHGAERREVLGATVSPHRPDPRDVAARLRGGCSSVADHDEAIESLLFLDRELRVARKELNDCREAKGGNSDSLRTQRNYLATENELLRARVDLLEGAADFTKQAFDYMEAFIAANGGEDVRYAADLVLCASRLQSAVGKLAALDVVTRSADTDGDEAQGLHLASLDEPNGRDGASSARTGAV